MQDSVIVVESVNAFTNALHKHCGVASRYYMTIEQSCPVPELEE